jgi:hypothetical protein
LTIAREMEDSSRHGGGSIGAADAGRLHLRCASVKTKPSEPGRIDVAVQSNRGEFTRGPVPYAATIVLDGRPCSACT